jgi:hypothetical protein
LSGNATANLGAAGEVIKCNALIDQELLTDCGSAARDEVEPTRGQPPHSVKMSQRIAQQIGVEVGGLMTTLLPAARAGAIL